MQYRTNLTDGRWIAAEATGSGPTVLLLHGIPGAGAVWNRVGDRLAAGHRVICPDLIGFGHSARSDDIRVLWADAQADGVLALLDDLEVTRALVVGHDFGGPVAAHLMAKAPSRFAGLVLASTNTFGDTPIPFPLSGILWPGIGGIWARMLFSAPSLRMMVRQGVGTNAPRLDPSVYVGDRGQVEAIRAIFSTALRELAKRYQPITDTLQGVHVPTRVVWGDRDPFFPLAQAERTAGLIEGATVTVLAGAGHFLPAERPTELADTIAALWRTIDA
jgi:pimeloyl-ACP methyl ester carboxylesterase